MNDDSMEDSFEDSMNGESIQELSEEEAAYFSHEDFMAALDADDEQEVTVFDNMDYDPFAESVFDDESRS